MPECQRCGMSFNCVCDVMTELESEIEILLITHPNEVSRKTNTGKLLEWRLSRCRSFVWDRKSPPQPLLDAIATHPNPIVMFPSEHSQTLEAFERQAPSPLFIVLDGTWQEAKKMWRQSPWLKTLPAYHLPEGAVSQFSLRRNQRADSLCTCEIGIELLNWQQQSKSAADLQGSMLHYFDAFQADRSGHAL